MPKVQSLKAKADYRNPSCKGKFYTTSVQIDWEGPVLHYKEGIFWKKFAFKDVVSWHVVFEPGGAPDKFGRLRILHIIKLQTGKALWEFALPPDVFESWLYWIIRSLVKHSKADFLKEQIKQAPLTEKHKIKTTALGKGSAFDRAHQAFIHTLEILQDPKKKDKLDGSLSIGEGGSEFGRIVKKIGRGGSDTVIYEIIQKLKPIKTGEEAQEKPVAVKVSSTDIQDDKTKMEDLIKEARVLALLGKHPNIVGLVDAVLAKGRLCLFLELGTTDLKHRKDEPLSSDDVFGYAQDILAGIAHMHKYRTYHLDMKMENVIICGSKGKGDVAKIIDFGLTRSVVLHTKKQLFEVPGNWAAFGTNGYISPEAWDWGQYDITREADLSLRDSYAVGMTIINGLIGPFLGEDEVAVVFGEQQGYVLNRIRTWTDRLQNDTANEQTLRNNKLWDLAQAALGLIAPSPAGRLTVEEALFKIRKEADIIKKKGMFEIMKI